ncbi:hypothetical protein [Liberiplasma polymorphum]|uniref:hypothetical protein n=1 Tax=Liberiplasma polymorphum TaxID=3374570 RepID=UPI0037744491
MNDNIEVNYISEKDIDLLIIEEFLNSKKFSDIFTKKLFVKDYNILKAYHSMVDVTYGESDIVFILETPNEKIGLLIENKIDAIAMPKQYERYEKRALKLIDQGLFDSYHVFIAAPELYLNTNYEASKYPNKVSYEEILEYLSCQKETRYRFKEVLVKNAIVKKQSGYTPIEDEAVTLFWQEYYSFKNKYFPHLVLNEVKGSRGANATWPWFNTAYKYVRIAHKSDRGFVDLTLSKLGEHIKTVKSHIKDKLHDEMEVIKTNKSISIRISVPKIDFKEPFHNYIDEMIICLKAVETLNDFLESIDVEEIYHSCLS